MALTLDATLKTAQDGDSHHIIAEVKNTGGQSIPFEGNFLTAETTDETNPNVITHSTGRICSISVFGTDKLQYIYSDAERRTFETTVVLDDTADLGLGGSVTITDCSIVELADATIGLVFVCYDGSNYYLRQSVLSIAGAVASNALIATYAISTYPEIRSPFCILMASGDYLLVYIIEDTTPDWNINKRTSGDFSSWSAEAAITPAGTDTAEKYNCSLCQIDTDDIFLLFDWTDATNITNCYYSISADNGATWGSAVAITSYDTTSKYALHPIAAQQATTEMHIVYNEIITPFGSYAFYDTTAVDAGSRGFYGGVYDGARYIYFVPYYDLDGTAYHGQVTRYDTQGDVDAAGSYAVYDTTAVDAGSEGFRRAVYDGARYIFFVPYYNGALSGQVTRYDTQGVFDNAGSWSVYDTTAVDADSKAFSGAACDGRYIYYSPKSGDLPAGYGIVTRYDTEGNFTAAGSYAIFDILSIKQAAGGFNGVVYDGSRYIFFAPYYNGADYHGNVVRYDTQGAFTDIASWTVYDIAAEINSAAKGFFSVTYDGSRYIYFVPGWDGVVYHGIVARYDTQGNFTASSSWATFDIATIGANLIGFEDAICDDQYLYFTPSDSAVSHGHTVRYDMRESFTASAAWSHYALTELDAAFISLAGLVYDNSQYIYYIPGARHGKLLRYDTQNAIAAKTSRYKINNWGGAAWALSAGLPSYSVYDTTAVHADSKGFSSAVYDGSRYIFFVPYNNGAYSGQVTRYDTQGAFTAAGSWSVYDTTAVDADSKGFTSAVYDGSRYIFFVPYNNGAPFGQVTRYDTQGAFTAAGSWSVYDTTAVDADSKGFTSAVYDGSRYIFFVPYNNGAYSGQVTRYDTQGAFTAAGSWSVYDTTAVDADSKGFSSAVYDGSRYIFFVPYNNGAYFGQVTRYDTQGAFTAAGSWSVYDTAAVDADSKGFSFAVYDGSRYIYFVPENNGAPFGQVTRRNTQEDFNGAAPKFIAGEDNSDTVICLEPTSNDFYTFWEKTISAALSLKWDKEFTTFDLSSYLATDKDIIVERTIDNKPARLSFALVSAQYFDESNVFAMLKIYLWKGSVITCRLGENVASTEYWQKQGSFHVKNRSLSYRKGVMPIIQVACEDSSSPLADMELITTRQYTGVFPETIIEQILNQKGSIDYSNISISAIDDRAPLYTSWTNTKILDIVGAICDRFGYFLRSDVDNSFDVKKITESASTDHTYTNRHDILEFIPDNDFSDYVNRIIVQSEERLFSQVTYPEKEIQLSHGTIGWWQGNEEIKIPYADDYSLQCLNPYPIIKNLKGNFIFKDKLKWSWTADSSNTYGILKLEAPLLIKELLVAVAGAVVGGKIPIIGNFINAAFLLEIFRILGSVTNWQATIMAQPIGYVKASVEGITDDVDFQAKIGRTVKRTISEPLAYTDAQCSFVSEYEMMITRLQRSRATIKKIGHLQDEEGDTIQIIHPISLANVKLYVTNVTRRVRIPSKSDLSGGMFDTLEGWQL